MKISFKLTKFEFKRAEYSKTFQEAVRVKVRNAARAFAREVILRVPVRTGFARGALLNLFDSLGIAASISGNGAREYYRGVLKTPDNARRYSTPIGSAFNDDGKVFKFNYAVTILYYEINDVNSNHYTPSAPWRSFEAGKAAFLDYLVKNGTQGLPAINQYIIKERTTYG